MRPTSSSTRSVDELDRDAPAEMAKIGMEGFQQFMVQPDQLDAILERLEAARSRIYK